MRLGLVSDLHGVLPDVPACDLLLIGGDLCPIYDHDEGFQLRWLDTQFRSWLEDQPMPVVGVAGNHDFAAESNAGRDVLYSLDWTYLENEEATVEGVRIWGSPYSNQFGRWAFMYPEEELNEFVWPQIPKGLDVLITHGPAYGLGDYVNNDWGPERNVGSRSLRAVIRDQDPTIHLTGHIHEGYGEYEHGKTRVYNASLNNERYDILDLNPIMVVELD